MVREFRAGDSDTPVVLMGYMNPMERYGHDEFARDAAAAGVDGVLMVDCPPEEMGDLGTFLDEQGIHPICLVAPTTTEARMESIAAPGSRLPLLRFVQGHYGCQPARCSGAGGTAGASARAQRPAAGGGFRHQGPGERCRGRRTGRRRGDRQRPDRGAGGG